MDNETIFFWIFMLVMDLILPLAMILLGRWLLKNPPKSRNAVLGYRTAWSMKSQDTWDFANRYCGKIWFRLGLILLPLSAVVLFFFWGRDLDQIGVASGVLCGVQTLALVLSVIPTQRALKKNFNEYGWHK